MENPEEILHSLEEFSKMKPKDIPRELEEYLAFVAKTGDPIYQWGSIKSLFREKLISVITEFYESCPVMEIPPCPNVDLFNYDLMKNFILDKLEAFNSAPFTLQRICELLTTPRKEYNRIDKFMRALEKNILVVSTVEPGGRRSNENGDGIMNGIETDPPVPEPGAEINIEEMDDTPSWGQEISTNHVSFEGGINSEMSSANQECIISCTIVGNQPYVSIEPLPTEALLKEKTNENSEIPEDTETSEQIEVAVKVVPEPDITKEVVVSDIISEATSQTQTQENTEENFEEVKNIPMSEAPIVDVSKDISSQLVQTVEKSEETETKLIDSIEVESVLKEEPENISPESSTESPENLEASANVEIVTNEEKITEKAENVDVIPDNKNDEEKQEKIKVELTEKVEKNEVKVLEKVEVEEKIFQIPKTEETIKIDIKTEEEVKENSKEQGDVKIDVETDAPIEEITEKVPETVHESVTQVETVKDVEETKIEEPPVEHMHVVESSEVVESIPEQKIDEDTATETDSPKIDDIVADEKPVTEEISINNQTKTKTPKTKDDQDSAPMEVDLAEEKIPESNDEHKKDEEVEVMEEKKEEPDQNKSDS